MIQVMWRESWTQELAQASGRLRSQEVHCAALAASLPTSAPQLGASTYQANDVLAGCELPHTYQANDVCLPAVSWGSITAHCPMVNPRDLNPAPYTQHKPVHTLQSRGGQMRGRATKHIRHCSAVGKTVGCPMHSPMPMQQNHNALALLCRVLFLSLLLRYMRLLLFWSPQPLLLLLLI